MVCPKNIERLKFFLQMNAEKQFIIITKKRNYAKKVQKFLLNNGFVWNGEEKWIDSKNIKSFYIYYTKNKNRKIKFRMLFSQWGSTPNERTINMTNVLKDLKKDKFINDLFKDII